jgi:hypothetical protein
MNQFQNLFDAQKAYFASNITRSYAWRVEQLDRMGRMIKENETALQEAIARDFKRPAKNTFSRLWPRCWRPNIRRANFRRG